MAGDLHLKESAVLRQKRKRSKRRVPIRIDMTPMVDIAFLLLIFYMVTTIFVMPQAMEINQPKTSDVIPVEDLLTIRVDSSGQYWWNIGLEKPDNLPEPFPPEQITADVNKNPKRQFLFEMNKKYPRLHTLLLIHRKANYKDMVDLLDEIELVERDMNFLIAREHGIKVDEIPDELTFSYRYAFDEWRERDDKIIHQSYDALKSGEGERQ